MDAYFHTGSLVSRNWKANTPQRYNNSGGWFAPPSEGTDLVCVERTLRWSYEGGFYNPAIITVKEVLADAAFLQFNTTTLHGNIQNTVAAAGVGNTVGMPGLFYHKLRDENNPASEYGVALTPNPANLQWVDSGPVHPEPFGPRDGKGKDVLEEAIRSLSPGTPVFINDWKMFHIRMGEVHCGSAAERQAAGGWWEK